MDRIDALESMLRAAAQEVTLESGPVAVLTLEAERRISTEVGVSRRRVEIVAVHQRILPVRYLRNLGTIGFDGQAKLLEATVAVVGSGGLGGWILEGLARMGVGRLIVIDGDMFEENNLNRQLLCTESSLGTAKTDSAAQRLAEVNGAVEVAAHHVWATAETLPSLLEGAVIAVDALDTLPTRLTLQETAQELGIPLVHGAIGGWTGQVMTILPGDQGLRALYGHGPIPERGIETELGNPAATPMMVAAWQLQEVVKLITSTGTPLRNRLLMLDALSGECHLLQVG